MAGRTTRELALHRTGRSRTRRRIVAATTAGLMLLGSAALADWVTASEGGVTAGGLLGGILSVTVEEGETVDVALAIVTEPDDVDGGFNPTQPCNIFPNPATLTLTPSSSSANATVPAAGIVFEDCTDTRTLTITGVTEGTADITFMQVMSNQGDGIWRTPPTIAVTVTEAGDPPPPPMELVCSNPAAPAWAAHILRENGLKSGSKDFKNYVAQVAHFMGPQTDFNDVEKDPAGTWANDEAMKTAFELQNRIYGEAVYDWLDDDADPSLTLYVPFNDIDGPSTSCVEVEVTPED